MLKKKIYQILCLFVFVTTVLVVIVFKNDIVEILVSGYSKNLVSLTLEPMKVASDTNKITFYAYGKRRFGLIGTKIFVVDLKSRFVKAVNVSQSATSPSWLNGDQIVYIDAFSSIKKINIDTNEITTLLEKSVYSDKKVSYGYPIVTMRGNVIIFEKELSFSGSNRRTVVLALYDLSTGKEEIIEDIRTLKVIYDNPVDELQDIEKQPFFWLVHQSGKEIFYIKNGRLKKYDILSKSKVSILDSLHTTRFDCSTFGVIALEQKRFNKHALLYHNLYTAKTIKLMDIDSDKGFYTLSPDDNFIAFSSPGNDGVFIYDMKIGKVNKITSGYYPQWINNDELIVRRGDSELYLVGKHGQSNMIFPSFN